MQIFLAVYDLLSFKAVRALKNTSMACLLTGANTKIWLNFPTEDLAGGGTRTSELAHKAS